MYTYTNGAVDCEVIARGNDEYIIINSRIYTGRGAPVAGNEPASYYLHECIIRPFEDESFCEDHCPNPPATPPVRTEDLDACFKGQLWPEKAGVFTPDDLVDLYRALKNEQSSVS